MASLHPAGRQLLTQPRAGAGTYLLASSPCRFLLPVTAQTVTTQAHAWTHASTRHAAQLSICTRHIRRRYHTSGANASCSATHSHGQQHTRKRQRKHTYRESRKLRCTMWPRAHLRASICACRTCTQFVRAEYGIAAIAKYPISVVHGTHFAHKSRYKRPQRPCESALCMRFESACTFIRTPAEAFAHAPAHKDRRTHAACSRDKCKRAQPNPSVRMSGAEHASSVRIRSHSHTHACRVVLAFCSLHVAS